MLKLAAFASVIHEVILKLMNLQTTFSIEEIQNHKRQLKYKYFYLCCSVTQTVLFHIIHKEFLLNNREIISLFSMFLSCTPGPTTRLLRQLLHLSIYLRRE